MITCENLDCADCVEGFCDSNHCHNGMRIIPESEQSALSPVESQTTGSPVSDETPRSDRSKRSGDSMTLLACSRQLELYNQDLVKELKHIADLLDSHFEKGGIVPGIGTTNKARQLIKANVTGELTRESN